MTSATPHACPSTGSAAAIDCSRNNASAAPPSAIERSPSHVSDPARGRTRIEQARAATQPRTAPRRSRAPARRARKEESSWPPTADRCTARPSRRPRPSAPSPPSRRPTCGRRPSAGADAKSDEHPERHQRHRHGRIEGRKRRWWTGCSGRAAPGRLRRSGATCRQTAAALALQRRNCVRAVRGRIRRARLHHLMRSAWRA